MPTPIGALLLLLLLLLSMATDTVSAINTNCQSVPDGYSTKIGTRCSQYAYCQGRLLTSTFTCPDGLLYNAQYCNWADNIHCALDGPLSGGMLVKTAAIDPVMTTGYNGNRALSCQFSCKFLLDFHGRRRYAFGRVVALLMCFSLMSAKLGELGRLSWC